MRLGSIGERIQICIPSVGLIRGRMAYFPTDPREVAASLHQVDQMRPAGILYLIKTFHFIVMGVEARKHDVATRHAVADRDVRIDWEASLSMFGVVSRNLLPNTPTESALMSSTVSSKIFGRPAPCMDTANNKAKERSRCFIISIDQVYEHQR